MGHAWKTFVLKRALFAAETILQGILGISFYFEDLDRFGARSRLIMVVPKIEAYTQLQCIMHENGIRGGHDQKYCEENIK